MTQVQSQRAADGSCLCPSEAELAGNRGPVRWTGGSGIFKQTFVGTLCLDVKGATSHFQLGPPDAQRPLCLGFGLPGAPPETGWPWRSFVLLPYPGADATEEDGRFA